MKKIAIFTALIFFSINNVNSQNFSLKYENEGNSSKILQFKTYKNLILSVDDSLKSLKERGYISAKVKKFIKIDSLNYEIELMQNHKIKYIKLLNIDSLKVDIKSIITDTNDNTIDFNDLSEKIDSSIKYLSNIGYPFAKIKLDSISLINPETVESKLIIDYGSERKIDKIKIKGYEDFPLKYIKYLLGIELNTILKLDNVKNRVKILNQTNFARNLKDPEILFTRDSTILYLYIQKIKKNTFDGFLGFNSDDQSGKVKIQGYAKINLINTFNNGENIKIDFISEDNQDRFLNSEIKLPYIFNSPIGLNSGISLVKKDSLYNSRKAFLNLDFSLKDINVGLGYESNNSTSNIDFENIESFKSELLNLFLKYESLDMTDVFMPISFKLFTKYGYGKKRQLNLNTGLKKLKIDLEKKFSVSNRFKINTRLLNERINSKNLVTNELLRFGGNNSIRGFDQNSIFADNYYLLNTSLNYYLNDTIYIYTLFDFANYENNLLAIKDNLYAGGFGFSSLTKNGQISINYAKGTNWGKSFNLKNAKLSVNFVTFF
ncbi:MAG: ShlB/FhaC/HecB family hemolysin secretion/activation protein [Flavobacteriaceae bacterium]